MTFLELCKATALKSGLVSKPNLMTTVVNQNGRLDKIVTAVADAWNTIQTGRTDWLWQRAQFSAVLVIGQSSYTPAQLGITTRFRSFVGDTPDFQPVTIYETAKGAADESELTQISRADWYTTYGRGAQTNTRPCYYAIDNGKLLVGPLPDKAYTLRGFYMKAAQNIAADADVPELPTDFHDCIKWRAILDLDGQDAAFADRAVAQAEYSRLYRLLVNEQTGRASFGGSLC